MGTLPSHNGIVAVVAVVVVFGLCLVVYVSWHAYTLCGVMLASSSFVDDETSTR